MNYICPRPIDTPHCCSSVELSKTNKCRFIQNKQANWLSVGPEYNFNYKFLTSNEKVNEQFLSVAINLVSCEINILYPFKI